MISPGDVAQMLVTIGAAAIGAFAATRRLTLEELTISTVLVATLGSAVVARPAGSGRGLEVAAVALAIVAFAAMFDGMWSLLGAAALVSLPFFGTALVLRDRRASLLDGCVAAIAAIALGSAQSAILILFVACLCAIGYVKLARRASSTARFAPYIGALTLVALLLQVSLVA